MTKIYQFLLLVLLLISCAEDNVTSVNYDNLEEKVDQAIYDLEYKDNVDLAVEVLIFIDDNEFKANNACLTNKILCLRAQKRLTIDGYDLILDYTKKALENEGCQNNLLKSYLYNLHGIYYHYTDLKKAKKYYEEAFYYGDKEEDKKATIDALFNLASIYFDEGNYKKSIENSIKGITYLGLSTEKKNRLKHFYIYIANSYLKLKDKENTKKTLETLEKIIDKELFTDIDVDESYQSRKQVYKLYAALFEQDNLNLSYQYLKKADSISNLREKRLNILQYNSLSKEIELSENLIQANKKVIYNQRLLLILSALSVIAILTITLKVFKTKNNLKKTLEDKEHINEKLKESLIEQENLNNKLVQKTKETQNLLKTNEKALFSKTLKLSTYKDAINNVLKRLTTLIDKNTSVNISKLIAIEKSLNGILSEEEIWQDFKFEFEKNRPDFFKKLLSNSPVLSITEQKHCAYVVTNLKSKEVASILNLSPRSVETIRYRIKKKLNLKETSLLEFLKSL